MIERWYQKEARLALWSNLNHDPDKNQLLVLPTGTGKSVIIANIIKDAISQFDNIKCLMLTHSSELVKQNAEKMQVVLPNIKVGIYSASLDSKECGEKITFATIASVLAL